MSKILDKKISEVKGWIALGLVLLIAGIIGVAGCGAGNKAQQPFKDAQRSGENSAPAETGTMPDGFSNWAAKCDGHNMVYTLFHGNDVYGGIAVAPNDPRCR